MHAWIFRHRHGLRSIWGLPPEPRLAGLMERARSGGAAVDETVDGTEGEGEDEIAAASEHGAPVERTAFATVERDAETTEPHESRAATNNTNSTNGANGAKESSGSRRDDGAKVRQLTIRPHPRRA